MEQPVEKKKVLVIGGGFGGVFAAKALERQGRGKLEVELVNANNYFVFQPLLPEVAASSIHSADAVVPLRQLLRRLQVRQAEVMGIDFAKKTVTVVQGTRRIPVDLAYDELVIALGTGVDLNRFPGLPEHALTMKDLADAHRLRTHVIGCLETADVTEDAGGEAAASDFRGRGRRLLRRRDRGGDARAGPPRAEILSEHQARRDPLLPRSNMPTASSPPFPPTSPNTPRGACKFTASRCLTGVGTKSATGTAVELTDGRIIPTSTIVATIGNGPHRLVESLGLDMHWGRIKTDRFMRVPGRDGRLGARRRGPHPAGRRSRARTRPTTRRRPRNSRCAKGSSLPPISSPRSRAKSSRPSPIRRRARSPRSA